MLQIAEPALSPIILVRDVPEAAEVVCQALVSFEKCIRIVPRLDTRPPRDRFDEILRCCVPPDTLDMLIENERVVALTRHGRNLSGFLRIELNLALFGEEQAFGITIGGPDVEAELKQIGCDVRPYSLPAPHFGVIQNTHHLAEFIFAQLDPDDDGLDYDFELTEDNIPLDPEFDSPAP